MNEHDKKEFKALMADALAFYRQDVSKFALKVWWSACERFSLEQLGKALTAHAMDPERGHFAPMPADIVKQLHGTQTDRSLIAWGKVLEAIQRVGAYQSVAFDDAAIHAAVEDLGGWCAICRSTMDALPHLQRRFTEAHRVYAARPGLAYPPILIGECEASNRTAGRPIAPPILIGNPEAAKQVMRGGAIGARVQITTLSFADAALKAIAA